MTIGENTINSISALVDILTKGPAIPLQAEDIDWPRFKGGRRRSGANEESPIQEWLYLSGKDYDLYIDCLDSLVDEPAVGNVTRRDLDARLWELALEVGQDWKKYQDSTSKTERVMAFLSSLEERSYAFEVMFEIEGISIPDDQITIGNVTFFLLKPDRARSWGISQDERPSNMAWELVGKAVAVAQVRAGSSMKARELAKRIVDEALNVLRVSALSFPGSRIRDFQLLQRIGMISAVKVFQPEPRVLPGWNRGFRGADLILEGGVADASKDLISRLEPLMDGRIPNKIRERLWRALQWLGSSPTRESYDDKILDLCTALECLLTTISDSRKGEAISVRHMLVAYANNNEGHFDPREILRLYGLRSKVVHGSERGMCTERDYRLLWVIVYDTFLQTIKFIEQTPTITRISRLIQILEGKSNLLSAKAWMDGQPDCQSLLNFVNEKLKIEL